MPASTNTGVNRLNGRTTGTGHSRIVATERSLLSPASLTHVPVVTEFDDPSVGVLDGWLATQEVPTPLTDALLADDAPTEEAARQQAVQLAQALEQSLNDTVGNVFIKWSKRFKHKYTSKGESNKALRKLAKALDQMAKHNADATSSSIEALNQFSDMEYDDFKAAMLVTIPPRSSKSKPGKGKGRKALQQALGVSDSAGGTERRELVASSINWAYRGITPPVMDQGLKCGSCWAMSSAAAIAAALALAYPGSAPQTFSAQYLVDCCNSQYGTADMGSQACVTGFADDVMAMAALYTVPLGGYYSAYTSGGTGRAGTCDTSKLHMTGARKWVMLNGSGKYGPQDPAGNVYGYDSVKYVTAYDENALIEAVAIQPVVFLFAVAAGFKAYGGGVYADSARECASVDLNHFMLLVGYDTGSKFWVVQNSWSASWGERGFARIKMDGTPNGVCQMYTQAYAPKLNNFRAVPDTVA